jgi:hypothetical protein
LGLRAGTVSAMSVIPVHPWWRGRSRMLLLSTAVMAAAAAAVLAVGTQDARLLRLGLVAALWAALLGAFAAAQMCREARSSAEHARQLHVIYQLELEREVTARREHILRVERELRQQAELSQRTDIGELRAEIAAMRANLELLGGAPLLQRVTLPAEPTRLLPLPAQARDHDDNRGVAVAIPARRGRIGPTPRSASSRSAAQEQQTVDDLLAAHGPVSVPRRRRSHTL